MAKDSDTERLQSRGAKSYSNISDHIYEDDGFFSDVPNTGSMSKSLIALNKYVKTNLLYESDPDEKCDSAYFSKESSPKDRGSKCDTESVKSGESFDKKDTSVPIFPKISHNNEISAGTDKKYLQHDYSTALTKVNNSHQSGKSEIEHTENNYDSESSEVHSHSSRKSSLSKSETQYPNMESTETVNTSQLQRQSINDKEKSINHYANLEVIQRDLTQKQYNSKPLNKGRFHSADDLTDAHIHNESRNDNTIPVAKTRTKFNEPIDDNPNSLLDWSEWQNRTNIYPDVYAPLPYSKYITT